MGKELSEDEAYKNKVMNKPPVDLFDAFKQKRVLRLSDGDREIEVGITGLTHNPKDNGWTIELTNQIT